MCSYGNLQESNTQYPILGFTQNLFGFAKDLLLMKVKILQSETIHVPLWEIITKSSSWKLPARSSAAVSRCSSTEVRKTMLIFFTNREFQLHFKGEYPCWLPYIIAVDLSPPQRLRPGIVLFVVHFMYDRYGSLGVHESQMPIVVSSPSESLRCHQSLRNRFLQHICIEKCCEDWKEKEIK